MKVRLLAQITGTRDGVEWPAPGEVLDVPDLEGADLVAAGIAAHITKAAPEAAVTPAPETAQHPTKPTRSRKS